MGVRFNTTRFHVFYGPDSLFERVRFKLQTPRTLKLHGEHFNKRFQERNVPTPIIPLLLTFNPIEWSVVTAEVRNDTGKFVNSTWEKVIEGKKYWITIGFGDVIQTIIVKDSIGTNSDIVKDGEFFQFVSRVNTQLMRQDNEQQIINALDLCCIESLVNQNIK